MRERGREQASKDGGGGGGPERLHHTYRNQGCLLSPLDLSLPVFEVGRGPSEGVMTVIARRDRWLKGGGCSARSLIVLRISADVKRHPKKEKRCLHAYSDLERTRTDTLMMMS